MKTNFEIEDNYAVMLNGIHIDLHNNFEFQNISERSENIFINFIKSKGNWIHKNEFSKLTFIHKEVSFKSFNKGDNSKFPEDENSLDFITFFPNNDRITNNGFIIQSKPKINDDIIYFFQNEKNYSNSM